MLTRSLTSDDETWMMRLCLTRHVWLPNNTTFWCWHFEAGVWSRFRNWNFAIIDKNKFSYHLNSYFGENTQLFVPLAMFSCNEERSIRPPILVHLLIQQRPPELGQILVLQLPPMQCPMTIILRIISTTILTSILATFSSTISYNRGYLGWSRFILLQLESKVRGQRWLQWLGQDGLAEHLERILQPKILWNEK